MATLTKPQQKHYDVLAEAVLADGRVVKRVEATASDLADVAEAFRLAAAAARQCHLTPARLRLTASRAGKTELAVVLDEGDPLSQSALLDGKTKVDAPPGIVLHSPVRVAVVPIRWTVKEILDEFARQAPDLAPFRVGGGEVCANDGRTTILGAVDDDAQADPCHINWHQYAGHSLKDVVATRLRHAWLR